VPIRVTAERVGLLKQGEEARRRVWPYAVVGGALLAGGLLALRNRRSPRVGLPTRRAPPAPAPAPNVWTYSPTAKPAPAPAPGPSPYERLMKTPPPGGWTPEVVEAAHVPPSWTPSNGFSFRLKPEQRWSADEMAEWAGRLRKEFSELRPRGGVGGRYDPSLMRSAASPMDGIPYEVTAVNRQGLGVDRAPPLFYADVDVRELDGLLESLKKGP